MASSAQPDISSELEKKEALAAGEAADNNPEEPMDGEDDGDVVEDEIVQIGATYSCRRRDGTYHDVEIMKSRMNKKAGREEFFVHYVGLNNRQNEWVDKTRLVISKPLNEGQEATNLELAEERKTPLKRKCDEGAPEAKKVKVDAETSSSFNLEMVSRNFAEELTCLLCSELFNDPVMVECGHNFCRNCIDKAWNGQESFTCSDCKEVISEKKYTTNRALANLVKKTIGATAVLTLNPKQVTNCPEHDERLKLYCKDDGILSCIICQDSLKHAGHNFVPIQDAEGVYRTELSAIMAPLEEALKVTEQLTSQQSEKVEQHKRNLSESMQHIVLEFEKMRTFLKEQEENLLEQLQTDGGNLLREMESNMVKLQENQDSIKQSIAMASERVNDNDSISFLTGIKSFIHRCQEQQKVVKIAENTLLSKDLCQGTFKKPIQYSVWKQMKSFIEPLASVQEPTISDSPERLPLSFSTVTPGSKELMDLSLNSVASGTQNCKERKIIWIVGHSLVTSARDRAAVHPGGKQLGLPRKKCRVFWFGKRNLKWIEMQQLLDEASEQAPSPDILIIHAGGNDLARVKSLQLTLDIKADIARWLKKWPGLKVIWSRIIQRKFWRDADSLRSVEKVRKKINRSIDRFVLSKGGTIVKHEYIDFKREKLYKADGERLSDNGIDVFNKSLQEVLERCFEDMD